MHIIKARGVHEAFFKGLQLIRIHGNMEDSRAGRVLVAPFPVVTEYAIPRERVLFDATRDANPFFHLAESLWMLAGANNAKWLDRYVRDFSERFAEADGIQHGAYGYRWRNNFGCDQLQIVGRMLKDDPKTRQAVLTMWSPSLDLGAHKKDIPCNTHIYFRTKFDHLDKVWVLDMTVCCRSNDLVWGAYGANAVHMSIMHEVVAALADMQVGTYYQISNNFHVYESILPKLDFATSPDLYKLGHVKPSPIVANRRDALVMLEEIEEILNLHNVDYSFVNPWLDNTARPVLRAHSLWKDGFKEDAIKMCDKIESTDWKQACRMWFSRRMKHVGELSVDRPNTSHLSGAAW